MVTEFLITLAAFIAGVMLIDLLICILFNDEY
jgi:hypothetical protein